jgi:hypothetical protein
MKMRPDALGTAGNDFGSAKHENGTRALRTVENVSRSAICENGTRIPRYRQKLVPARKTLKRDPTHSAPSKTCPGEQNMKAEPDALGTVEDESRRAKLENGTRRPPHRENESGRAKHENGTRHPLYRRI